jgi:hypothetical protein
VSSSVLLDVMQADMTAGGDGMGGFRLSLGVKKATVTPVVALEIILDSSALIK